MKILTVIGARPQFIKASIVSRYLCKYGINEIVLHTGQHFDENMSDVFFQELELPKPDYHLGIHSLKHGAMTGRMIEGIESIILKEKPSLVLVYGDTNSTLAGALAGVKLHIPVAHIESGLRSFDMNMPEEINRILTDRISSFLFCPSQNSVMNLKIEGFEKFKTKVIFTGDVMFDLYNHYDKLSYFKNEITDPYVLVTLHREENTSDTYKLKSLVNTLNLISREYKIIMPIHPRTNDVLSRNGLNFTFETINPVGYFEMINLIKNCTFVITDSGGIQKEAYFCKKHCIVLRENTEWTELIDYGYNFLVGNNVDDTFKAIKKIENSTMSFIENFYGDGDAAIKIVETLKSLLLTN